MTKEPATLQLYFRAQDIWEAMYQDCVAARKSIELDQYILLNDDTGRRFMKLFLQKAKEGISVSLLLDRVGSRQFFMSPIVAEIRRHGGHVIFYNPVGWLDLFFPKTWFPRNHVKAMMVDGRIAHVGSACFADYMARWHEMHARMENTHEHGFATLWDGAKKKRRGGPFDYRLSNPLRRHFIYRELLASVNRAQKCIYLATPYLLPPTRLRRALRAAVRRGVDVRIMVTRKSDVPFASLVSHSYFQRLIRRGVRLFFYNEELLHAKYAVIDQDWAMLGSTNIDYLSLLVNREASLIVRDPAVVAQMRAHFLEDLEKSSEIDASFWRDVPLYLKAAAYMGRCLKKVI